MTKPQKKTQKQALKLVSDVKQDVDSTLLEAIVRLNRLRELAVELVAELAAELAPELAEPDAEAAALATSDCSGCSSIRMIEISEVTSGGISFFAKQHSGKAEQIAQNPFVSLCFYWPRLKEQVNIETKATLASSETSDSLWEGRSRDSKLVAWFTEQGRILEDSDSVSGGVAKGRDLFGYGQLPRDSEWQAFTAQPHRIEFWPSGRRRASERTRYSREEGGDWLCQKVSP